MITMPRTGLARIRSKIGAFVTKFFDMWADSAHRIMAASPWGENRSVFFAIFLGILVSSSAVLVNLTHPLAEYALWAIIVFGWFLVLSGILAWGVSSCHFSADNKPDKNSVKGQNDVDRA
jgi:hypothetical protein